MKRLGNEGWLSVEPSVLAIRAAGEGQGDGEDEDA